MITCEMKTIKILEEKLDDREGPRVTSKMSQTMERTYINIKKLPTNTSIQKYVHHHHRKTLKKLSKRVVEREQEDQDVCIQRLLEFSQ